MFDRNAWKYLTVKKKSSSSFKNVMNKMCLQIIYSIYMYTGNLALNNLQWLICHKTNQPTNHSRSHQCRSHQYRSTKLFLLNRGQFGIALWPDNLHHLLSASLCILVNYFLSLIFRKIEWWLHKSAEKSTNVLLLYGFIHFINTWTYTYKQIFIYTWTYTYILIREPGFLRGIK